MDRFEPLISVLEAHGITKLSLKGHRVRWQEAESMARALETNTTLQVLDLPTRFSWKESEHKAVRAAFVKMLRENESSSLEVLNLPSSSSKEVQRDDIEALLKMSRRQSVGDMKPAGTVAVERHINMALDEPAEIIDVSAKERQRGENITCRFFSCNFEELFTFVGEAELKELEELQALSVPRLVLSN